MSFLREISDAASCTYSLDLIDTGANCFTKEEVGQARTIGGDWLEDQF